MSTIPVATGNQFAHRRASHTARNTGYWAVKIRLAKEMIWRVYCARSMDDAIRKGENIANAIEVVEANEISREQYDKAVELLKKGVVK